MTVKVRFSTSGESPIANRSAFKIARIPSGVSADRETTRGGDATVEAEEDASGAGGVSALMSAPGVTATGGRVSVSLTAGGVSFLTVGVFCFLGAEISAGGSGVEEAASGTESTGVVVASTGASSERGAGTVELGARRRADRILVSFHANSPPARTRRTNKSGRSRCGIEKDYRIPAACKSDSSV